MPMYLSSMTSAENTFKEFHIIHDAGAIPKEIKTKELRKNFISSFYTTESGQYRFLSIKCLLYQESGSISAQTWREVNALSNDLQPELFYIFDVSSESATRGRARWHHRGLKR